MIRHTSDFRTRQKKAHGLGLTGKKSVTKIGRAVNQAAVLTKITACFIGNSLTANAPIVPSGDALKGTNGHDNLENGTGLNQRKDAGKIIYGYDGNNTITNYADNVYVSGGKGNDSLWGGAGSDTLYGGAGKDVFICTVNEGTDKIFDYTADDMLKILNVDGSNGKFKSSKFSGSDLTLAIKGGGKVIFSGVSADGTFNINSATYKISGTKLVK